MTDKDIEIIEQRLKKKIASTERKIVQMEDMTQPIGPENSIGRISRMDAINNKSVQEAALRTAKINLGAYKSALLSLKDPTFGKCVRCNEQIPIQRLLLMPASRYCVHCAR